MGFVLGNDLDRDGADPFKPLQSANSVSFRAVSAYNALVPPRDAEQRKLAAIMFTDMVGYSALAQRDDRLALELLEEHRRLLREIFLPVQRHRDHRPSATLSSSNSPARWKRAQCAIEIQRTLAKRNP
jgi:hypothetical protein